MALKAIVKVISILMLVRNCMSVEMKVPEIRYESPPVLSLELSDQEQSSPVIMGKQQIGQGPTLRIPPVVRPEARFQLREHPPDGQRPIMKIPDIGNSLPELTGPRYKVPQYPSSILQEGPRTMHVPSGINGLPQPMGTKYQIPQDLVNRADQEAQEAPQPQDKVVPYGNDGLIPPVEDQFWLPQDQEISQDKLPVMNIPYGIDALVPPVDDQGQEVASLPKGLIGSPEDFQFSTNYQSSDSLSYSYYSILNKLGLTVSDDGASDSGDGSEFSEDFQFSSDYQSSDSLSYYSILNKLGLGVSDYGASDSGDDSEFFSWRDLSESSEESMEWDEDSFTGEINRGRKLLALKPKGFHNEQRAGDFKHFKKVIERLFKNKKVKRDVEVEDIAVRGKNEFVLFPSDLTQAGDGSILDSYEDSLEYSSYEDSLQYSADDDYENRVHGYEEKVMENIISWVDDVVDGPGAASSEGNEIKVIAPLWETSNQEYDYTSGSFPGSSDSSSNPGWLFSSPEESSGGNLWPSSEGSFSGQDADYSSSSGSFVDSSANLLYSSSLSAGYSVGDSASIPSESSGSQLSDYYYSSDSFDVFGNSFQEVFDVDMGTPDDKQGLNIFESLSFESSKDYSMDSFGNPIAEFGEDDSNEKPDSDMFEGLLSYDSSIDYSMDSFGNPMVDFVKGTSDEKPNSDMFEGSLSYDSSVDYSMDSSGNPIAEVGEDDCDKNPDSDMFEGSLSYDSSMDYSMDSFGNPIAEVVNDVSDQEPSSGMSADSSYYPSEDSVGSIWELIVKCFSDGSDKKPTNGMSVSESINDISDNRPASSIFAGLFAPSSSEGGSGLAGPDQDDSEFSLFSQLFSSLMSSDSYDSYESESVDSYQDEGPSGMDQDMESIFSPKVGDLIDNSLPETPDVSRGEASGGRSDEVRQGLGKNTVVFYLGNHGSENDDADTDKLTFKENNFQYFDRLSSQVEPLEDGGGDADEGPMMSDIARQRPVILQRGDGLKDVNIVGGKSILVYSFPLALLLLLVFFVLGNRFFRRTPKIVTVDPESGISDYYNTDTKENEPLLREEMTYRD